MPSMRRMRIFGILVITTVIYILYLTSTSRHSQDVDFYSKTKDALDLDKLTYHPHKDRSVLKKQSTDDDEALAAQMANRLRDADAVAKDTANSKAPPREGGNEEPKPKSVVEALPGEKSVAADRNVAGRKKYPIDDGAEKQKVVEQSEEDHDVELELNSILKRSPIIIFSKSYCPHSRRAKGILLEKYSVVPAPFVVELDQHPQGSLLQDRLAKMTGRRTVPNILINGKSIGGGDEIAELDERRTLIGTLISMGGKRMQEVVERPETLK